MDPRCFFGIGCKIDLTSGVSKPSFDSNYAIPKLFFRMDADSIGIIGTARYFFFFLVSFAWFSLVFYDVYSIFCAREENNRACPHCLFYEVLDLSREWILNGRVLGKN